MADSHLSLDDLEAMEITSLDELERYTAEVQRRLLAGEPTPEPSEVGTYTPNPPGRPGMFEEMVLMNIKVDRAYREQFMAKCKEEGKTASEVIRHFMDEYLSAAA